MQYCSLGFFFLLAAGPVLCHIHSRLLPCSPAGPFYHGPASQQLWQLIWPKGLLQEQNCTARSHLFPYGFEWVAYYKPISKPPWSKYSEPDAPVQRAEALQTGCCISRPGPAKPNILRLTKECAGNLRNAEPRWRRPVPKLLCFSSKSELCWTSLTKASWKIFSGLTEKHAKI